MLDNGIGQYALCVMDGSDEFEYVIAGEYRGGEVPEGMKLYALPESLQRLNAAVWGEWLHGEGRATAIRRSRSTRRAIRNARTTSAVSGCR